MLVGRQEEIKKLEEIYYKSDKPELIAVYGRRRVGKTYLIDEVYRDKMVFRHSGIISVNNKKKRLNKLEKKDELDRQLLQFYYSLLTYGYKPDNIPTTWIEAFFMLSQYLNSINNDKKKIVFIDELPWMDTAGSYFIEAFEGFWNNYCANKKNLILVVCGSSSSWILSNLVQNVKGLYKRVTYQINLKPFTLKECEEYFIQKGMELSKYDIAEIYMTVGGIPYYLSYFEPNLSVAQNIDNMFFNSNASLTDEFDFLFSSQFVDYKSYQKLIEVIGSKRSGMTSNEIMKEMNMASGGTFYEMLKALKIGGFIKDYSPFGEGGKEKKYRIIDPFSLFYIRFVKELGGIKNNYFLSNVDNQKIVVWKGLAFENLCFNHVEQIKKKLWIFGVDSDVFEWSKKGSDDIKGAQIDLVIKRKDNVVNLCEIKFYSGIYTINKDNHLNLINKREKLREILSPKESIQNVLITTYGLKNNEYSSDYVNIIILDDLFI